jgi:hypothetical protein
LHRSPSVAVTTTGFTNPVCTTRRQDPPSATRKRTHRPPVGMRASGCYFVPSAAICRVHLGRTSRSGSMTR